MKNADLILNNGYIYTVDAERTVAEAIAIRDGEIILVGSNDEMETMRGPETQVLDLAGRMVLPGLHDVHMHIFGIVEPDVCSLESQEFSLAALVPVLQECLVRYQPAPGEWLAVDMWNFSDGNEASERFPSIRSALDAVSSENPIILWGNDGHHGAVNSAALALAKTGDGQVVGLSAASLANEFAEYIDLVGVDASGAPNGELNEQARGLLGPKRRDPAVLGPLMPEINQVLARNGITSAQDASLTPDFLPSIADYEASGAMRMRLNVATRLDPLEWKSADGEVRTGDMMAELESIRQQFLSSPLVKANAAKIYVDGVIEGNPLADPPTLPNAAVLEPYKQPRVSYNPQTQTASINGYVDTDSEVCGEVRSDPGRYRDQAARETFVKKNGFHPAQCTISRGVLRDQEPFVNEYVRRLNEAGFTVHIHAIGDRAVRVATNALDAVLPGGGENPLRHTLAHLQLIHPDDQQRIGELGLYLAYTYAWMIAALPYDMTVIPFLEEIDSVEALWDPDGYYMQYAYPVRSTQLAGAILVAGSDAPVDDRSPRPFINMAAGITRQVPGYGPLNQSETIDVHEMIAAYTINGAQAMSHESVTGSISAGKKADLVVLDQNIVELYEQGQAGQIAETRVDMTLFEGEVIYRDE